MRRVRPAGFEPATLGSEDCPSNLLKSSQADDFCSIQNAESAIQQQIDFNHSQSLTTSDSSSQLTSTLLSTDQSCNSVETSSPLSRRPISCEQLTCPTSNDSAHVLKSVLTRSQNGGSDDQSTKCPSERIDFFSTFCLAEIERINKLLTRLLRHHPEAFGLTMDSHGWIKLSQIADLLNRICAQKSQWSPELVAHLLASQNRNERYQISLDSCRASYGHSSKFFHPNSYSTPEQPLFHGTHALAVSSIMSLGLQAMGRRYVQLTTDYSYAAKIAAKNQPEYACILQIRTQMALDSGVGFHQTGTHVWLSNDIPPDCLEIWLNRAPDTDQSEVLFPIDPFSSEEQTNL